MVTVAELLGEMAEIVEFVVATKATVTRKPLRDLELPRGMLIVAVLLNLLHIPRGDFHIAEGDRVLVFLQPELAAKARHPVQVTEMHADIIAKALGLLLLVLAIVGTARWPTRRLGRRQPIMPWIWMIIVAVASGGGLMWVGHKANPDHTGIKEGMAITSLTWLATSLVAGIGIG